MVLNDDELYSRIHLVQKSVGAVPSPFDSWLTLRGVKTLAVRMRQHEKNASRVAEFMQGEANVEKVYFPGLKTHPGHETAKKQMTGFGGIVSFEIKGGLDEANSFFRKLKVFQLADSLGGVESLANYSAIMTHEAFPPELRKKIKGSRFFIATSTARTTFSPYADPILPPIKLKSIAANTTIRFRILASP